MLQCKPFRRVARSEVDGCSTFTGFQGLNHNPFFRYSILVPYFDLGRNEEMRLKGITRKRVFTNLSLATVAKMSPS